MGTHHKSDKEARKKHFAAQFMRTELNKKRKLEKHIRKHPNDKQSIRSLEKHEK